MASRKGGANLRPKHGRPIVGGEPKDRRIALRATKSTADRLLKCSELSGKTQTALLEEMVNRLYHELTGEK